MDDRRLGEAIRSVRHRRSWRQSDLAARAQLSSGVVGLIERGRADLVALRKIRCVCAVLGIRLEWDVGWRGPDLHRMRDADHAALATHWKRWLEDHGYLVRAEVSFNRYGDRGRIDLLAFGPQSRVLLVIEVKTVLVDAQELLGTVDVKARVGRNVAAEIGWSAGTVVPVIILAERTTNRRRLVEHAALFSSYAVRGREALAWLRRPARGVSGVLVLSKLPDRKHTDGRRAGRQRVRRTAADVSVSAAATDPAHAGFST
jgi:transcriptional regulator with XRE-family HTH domain